MKALRYLLITIAIMMAAGVSVQSMAQSSASSTYPGYEFQSTSVMPTSGSSLPQAASSGVAMADEHTPGRNIRKIGGGNSGGGTGPSNPDDPYATPIGEGMWPLALLALVYGVWCMVYKRNRNVKRLKS